jgi:hypothetical protein
MNILNKNNKTKIATLSLLTLLSLSFTACGGGSDDASFANSETLIDVDVNCTTPATISTYITVNSGDVIVKKEDNTTISIYHDVNGTKKVCLESGSAYIIQQ